MQRGEEQGGIRGPHGVPGREAIDQPGGQSLPDRRGQARNPLHVLPQHAELPVVEFGRAEQVGRRRVECRRGGGMLDRPIPDHHGAGHEVTEALAARVHGDRDRADQVRRGEEIGDTEEVPGGGGGEGQGVPAVAHHPDAQAPLAGSLSLAEPLEKREVAPDGGEPDDRQEREGPGAEATGQQGEGEAQEQAPRGQDRGVDERRERARPEARDLVVEQHVLGGFDLEVLPEVGRGGHRGRAGDAAIYVRAARLPKAGRGAHLRASTPGASEP